MQQRKRPRRANPARRKVPRKGGEIKQTVKFRYDNQISSVASLSRVMPAQMDIVLRYPIAAETTSAAATKFSVRWQPNAAFDMDPVLGSTAIPGFTEYSALYQYNRIIAFRAHFEVANEEAFPITGYLVVTNTDPSTAGTNFIAYAQQKYGQQHTHSAQSGAKDVVTYHTPRIPVADVVGTPIEYEDNWRGTSAANPADLIYLALGFDSASNSFTANKGVLISGWIQVWVRFFDRTKVTTFKEQLSLMTSLQEQREQMIAAKRKAIWKGENLYVSDGVSFRPSLCL